MQLAVAAGQDELSKLAIEADKPFEQEDAYQRTMARVIELGQQIEAMSKPEAGQKAAGEGEQEGMPEPR